MFQPVCSFSILLKTNVSFSIELCGNFASMSKGVVCTNELKILAFTHFLLQIRIHRPYHWVCI